MSSSPWRECPCEGTYLHLMVDGAGAVCIFPNRESVLRLSLAILKESHEAWVTLRHYLKTIRTPLKRLSCFYRQRLPRRA